MGKLCPFFFRQLTNNTKQLSKGIEPSTHIHIVNTYTDLRQMIWSSLAKQLNILLLPSYWSNTHSSSANVSFHWAAIHSCHNYDSEMSHCVIVSTGTGLGPVVFFFVHSIRPGFYFSFLSSADILFYWGIFYSLFLWCVEESGRERFRMSWWAEKGIFEDLVQQVCPNTVFICISKWWLCNMLQNILVSWTKSSHYAC